MRMLKAFSRSLMALTSPGARRQSTFLGIPALSFWSLEPSMKATPSESALATASANVSCGKLAARTPTFQPRIEDAAERMADQSSQRFASAPRPGMAAPRPGGWALRTAEDNRIRKAARILLTTDLAGLKTGQVIDLPHNYLFGIRSYGTNASSTFPGAPPWNPVYPDPTSTMPCAPVGPGAPIDPP